MTFSSPKIPFPGDGESRITDWCRNSPKRKSGNPQQKILHGPLPEVGFECRTNSNLQPYVFDPDGRLLTQFDLGKLESWDFQTGGLVGSIPIAAYISSANVSFVHSADGNAVAVAYRDQGGDTIDTYDLLSSTRIRSRCFSQGPIIKPIWTRDERLRFAALKPESVIIWEVTSFSTHAPLEVKSLPAPDEITDGKVFDSFLVSPASLSPSEIRS